MFIAGPDVSLHGSPTVSPTMAALCALLPLPPCAPVSIYFFESFDKDLPFIMADKEQIILVCKNIINNSRRAINGRGGLKVATAKGMDNNVTVTFYDSGRGIPSNVIDKIFDPFFVVNEEERGMGLGLCVSSDIIKRHGGTLTVKSQKEKGTIFQLTLPIDIV